MPELVVHPRHKALADAQPLTERAFADTFRRMQATPEPVEIRALRPEQTSVVGWQALAFAWAEKQDFLPKLVHLVVNKVVSEAFIKACKAANVPFEGNLQAILDDKTGFIKTHQHNQKFPIAASQVCRVLVDGTAVGTGFLVKPRVVATAYHVIEKLVEYDPVEGKHQATSGSHLKLSFEFGLPMFRIAGASDGVGTNKVLPTQDWLANCSEYHPQERTGHMPVDAADLANFHDYALIRLSSVVRLDLSGIALETEERLGARDQPVTIIQHPHGAPMRHDRKTAQQTAPPGFRVAHVVNTEKGSSGAPCLNEKYRAAAMHQAGPQNGPFVDGITNANRCVPIDQMASALDQLGVLDAGLMPISALSSGEKVIGRSQLLRWVYGTLDPSGQTPPILVVASDTAIPGRTFTVALLQELLAPEDNRIFHLHAPDFQSENLAGTLAKLFAKIGKTVPPIEDSLSANASQLRRAVMSSVVPALAADDGAMTWIVLDDFDRTHFDGQDGGTRDFFDALFKAISPTSKVRLVVIQRGEEFPIPPHISDAETEHLGPPQGDEVEILARRSGVSRVDGPEVDLPGGAAVILMAFGQLLQNFKADKSYYREVMKLLLKT